MFSRSHRSAARPLTPLTWKRIVLALLLIGAAAFTFATAPHRGGVILLLVAAAIGVLFIRKRVSFSLDSSWFQLAPKGTFAGRTPQRPGPQGTAQSERSASARFEEEERHDSRPVLGETRLGVHSTLQPWGPSLLPTDGEATPTIYDRPRMDDR